jgi:hypothetical protein
MTSSNTSKWIPHEAIASIVIVDEDYRDWPYLSGTGFFVVFEPYPSIFFVTARHCVLHDDGRPKGIIQVPWKNSVDCREAVPFIDCLAAKTQFSGDHFEDICVFVVGNFAPERLAHLRGRALKLQHQDNVDAILSLVDRERENLRTIGFPGCSKAIDYDEYVNTATPRGTYGKIIPGTLSGDEFSIGELNWRGDDITGFSGSPVLSLHPTPSGDVVPVVVGVLVRGSATRFTAININVATNVIASWISGDTIDENSRGA